MFLSKLIEFFKCEKGIAAVEFALITPVLILILLGTIDFGTFINNKMRLQDLARSSAEYVVQGGDINNVVTGIIETSDFYVDSQNAGLPFASNVSQVCECAGGAAVACGGSCVAAGDYLRSYIEVQINGTYSPMFVYPGIADSITIIGYSRMQYEN